jgi:hypothetical protein
VPPEEDAAAVRTRGTLTGATARSAGAVTATTGAEPATTLIVTGALTATLPPLSMAWAVSR